MAPALPAVSVVAALSQRAERGWAVPVRRLARIFCRSLELQQTAVMMTASRSVKVAPTTTAMITVVLCGCAGVTPSGVGMVEPGIVDAAWGIASVGLGGRAGCDEAQDSMKDDVLVRPKWKHFDS